MDRDLVEVVHRGAAECPVGNGEARRLDQMRLDVEAGAKPQNRSSILGDIGLVERDREGLSDGQDTGSGDDKIHRETKGLWVSLALLQRQTCTPPVRVP